jgi:hypothetical protein
MTAVLILTLLLWWGCGALLVYRSGERDFCRPAVNLPFALLWPVALPVTVALGILWVWDQDLDLTE